MTDGRRRDANIDSSLDPIRAAIEMVADGSARRVTVYTPAPARLLPAARALARAAGVAIESADGTDAEPDARWWSRDTPHRLSVADQADRPAPRGSRSAGAGSARATRTSRSFGPYEEIFERGDDGELIATERTVLDRPGGRAPCGGSGRSSSAVRSTASARSTSASPRRRRSPSSAATTSAHRRMRPRR